jgi:hypothetical protein
METTALKVFGTCFIWFTNAAVHEPFRNMWSLLWTKDYETIKHRIIYNTFILRKYCYKRKFATCFSRKKDHRQAEENCILRQV